MNVRITPSRAAAILGLSKSRTRDDVMRQVVREALGEPNETPGNIAAHYTIANRQTAIGEASMLLDIKPIEPISDGDILIFPDGKLKYKDKDAYLFVFCPFGDKDKTELPSVFDSTRDQMLAQVRFQLYTIARATRPTKPLQGYVYQWAPGTFRLDVVAHDPKLFAQDMIYIDEFIIEAKSELEQNADYYKQPLRVTIESHEAQKLLDEYDQLTDSIEFARARQKDLLAEIVKLAGEKNAEICGRKLTKVQKQGAISYAKAIKELVPDADLEKWRGKPSEYWLLG